MQVQSVIPEVSAFISTTGNIPALCLTISSILNGSKLPKEIYIRFEQEDCAIADFYLEQLFAIARFRGVTVHCSFYKSEGVRCAREAVMTEALLRGIQWVWSVDDDVLYQPDFLELLWEAQEKQGVSCREQLVYLFGAKPEITDRQKTIEGFTNEVADARKLCEHGPANLHWSKSQTNMMTVKSCYPDTGALLYHPKRAARKGASFNPHKDSFHASGEDSLFGMQVFALGGIGFFVPSAQAIHLNKPRCRFDEATARSEAVLRSAVSLKIPSEFVEPFMPHLKRKRVK